MQFSTLLTWLLTLSSLAFAWPHHHGHAELAQIDEDVLEKPLHTTALMAGEAWKLTERVRNASPTRFFSSTPTQTTAPEQYEL